MAHPLLVAAAELAPQIRALASEVETLRALPPVLLEALHERRLFRLCIPRSTGGEELDLPTALRIYELLSSADGSVGWSVMIGAGAGLFAGFLERATAQQIFGPRDAVIAGSGAPSGTASAAADGYRVTGRWSFASGSRHATWFTANCVLDDGSIRSVAVPAAEVEVFDTWSVLGLRGTASHDFAIRGSIVPAERTFSVVADRPNEPGPLYRFPFVSCAELSFGAVALGLARCALEEFAALANVKRSFLSETVLADDADVRARFARAEAAARSSRAWLYDMAEHAWERVASGAALTDAEQADVRLACVDAVERCAGAVDALYRRAGMTPLFSTAALGRAWRDIHTLTQNAAVSPGLYSEVGLRLLR